MSDYIEDLLGHLKEHGVTVSRPDPEGRVQLTTPPDENGFQTLVSLTVSDRSFELVGFGFDGMRDSVVRDGGPITGDPSVDAANVAESFDDCVDMINDTYDDNDELLEQREQEWEDWEDDWYDGVDDDDDLEYDWDVDDYDYE